MTTQTLEHLQTYSSQEVLEFIASYKDPDFRELSLRNQVVKEGGIPTPPIERYRLSETSNVEIVNIHADMRKGGSFKSGGAHYAMQMLTQSGENQVATASAGNHAQGVALAAAKLNMHATIFMSKDTPPVKIEGVRTLGGSSVTINTDSATFANAQIGARDFAHTESVQFLSAYDNGNIIAGQGTVVFEALLQNPDADEIVVGVGGGGLLAGVLENVATLKREGRINPYLKVIAVVLENENDSLVNTRDNNWIPTPATRVNTFTEGTGVIQVGDIPAFISSRNSEDLEIDKVSKEDIAWEYTNVTNRNDDRIYDGLDPYPMPETTSLAILASASKRALHYELDGNHPKKILTITTGNNADPVKIKELRDMVRANQELYERRMTNALPVGRRTLVLGGLVGAR